MKFRVGDAVWVYRAALRPKPGVVTEITDYHGVRVEIDDRWSRNDVYAACNVFSRPEDREKLIGMLRDDAESLERYAGELEELCTDD